MYYVQRQESINERFRAQWGRSEKIQDNPILRSKKGQ